MIEAFTEDSPIPAFLPLPSPLKSTFLFISQPHDTLHNFQW